MSCDRQVTEKQLASTHIMIGIFKLHLMPTYADQALNLTEVLKLHECKIEIHFSAMRL